MVNSKNLHGPINNRSHTDILREYSQRIQETFEQIGGIAPPIDYFYPSTKWKYCQTINKKDKKKIGYVCEFGSTQNSKPFVRITINNFKLGSITFNSLTEDKNTDFSNNKSLTLVKPSFDFQAAQRQDAYEIQKSERLFQEKLKQWANGSADIASHPYFKNKQLSNNPRLRVIDQHLIYPLIDSKTGQYCGVQTIDKEGNKRIYGKKKEAYSVLGDLDKASTIYICEGYATANAVFQLASNYSSFAVVNALDCHNLISITQWVKSYYQGKKIVIAADNDKKTASEGKGNAGLWYGLDAAIQTQAILIFPELPENENRNIDWCDVWIENPELAKQAFQQKKNISLKKQALERLKYASLNLSISKIETTLYQIMKSLLPAYPIELSEEALLEKVYSACKALKITQNRIKSIWIKVKKRHFAKALRSKSFSFNPESNHYTVTEFNNLHEISLHVADLKKQHPRAIFITNAPMGTGKTQQLMKPHFSQDIEQNRLPVIITPTRSLTKSIAERFDATHYKTERTDFEKQGLPSSLAITINSIIHLSFEQFLDKSQSLFIDEYTQVLRSIMTGTVQDESRRQTHQKLSKLMNKAHYTYIADADLNAIALDEIGRVTNNTVPIFVMTLPKQNQSEQIYQFHHYQKTRLAMSAFQQTIEDAIEQNEKLYIVSDSRKKIAELSEKLKKLAIKPLIITAESVRTIESQAFLTNPDSYLEKEKPDIVIVSPAVQSGLSIESTYFNRLFGIYTGTVTPTVFNQMLQRVRAPIPREIVLPNQKPHGQTHLENPAALLAASYGHYLQQFGSQQVTFNPITGITQIGRLSIKTSEEGSIVIEGDRHEHFERLSAEIKAMDYQQRNNAAAFLVLQSMAAGFDINIKTQTLNETTKQALKEEEKAIQQAVLQSRQKDLCGVNTLTKEQYQQKINTEIHSVAEIHAIKRYEIASSLYIDEIRPDDLAFFDEQGIEALNNYEDLKNGLTNAQTKDEIEQKNTISKGDASWTKAKLQLLTTLFTLLEIDKVTGKGCYNKTKAAMVRDAIRQDDVLSRFILYKLELAINSSLSDVAWVNKILKKLLQLKTTRTMVREGQSRIWYYSIQSSFYRLNQYFEKRVTEIFNDSCHQK